MLVNGNGECLLSQSLYYANLYEKDPVDIKFFQLRIFAWLS